jgi:hypothetical protein
MRDGEECPMLAGFHHECAARMVLGSVGHQLRMCSCFGGGLEDPPGFSRRDCSRLAMRIAQLTRGEILPSVIGLAYAQLLFPDWRASIPDWPVAGLAVRGAMREMVDMPDGPEGDDS